MFVVSTDASDYAVGGTLEQYDTKGKPLGVVAFTSKTLTPPQLKYPVREKELFAIVHCMTVWRPYLLGTHFKLRTDHESLVYIPTSKISTGRLSRWLDFVSEFDFQLEYIRGEKNKAPDALSRIELNAVSGESQSGAVLERSLRSGYANDHMFGIVYRTLIGAQDCPNELRTIIKRYSIIDDLLYYRMQEGDPLRLCIPEGEFRERLMEQAHRSPASGHPGPTRMFSLLQSHYYWPKMPRTVKRFCRNCPDCQRSKTSTLAKKGIHRPLSIPSGRWESISLDFITGLTPTATGLDCILVVVDRLTKRAHFIATTKALSAQDCADIFVKEIFRLHGLPKSLVSDRDVRFVSNFWRTLHAMLGISLDMSTPYHPESDGQTERTHRTLQQMLRPYLNDMKSDWSRFLPALEFGYNNAYQSSLKMSPFKADLGYEPRFMDIVFSTEENRSKSAEDFLSDQEALCHEVRERMAEAQDAQSVQVNRHRTTQTFERGDQVLLHRDVYAKTRRNSKLHVTYIGPFTVSERVNDNAYRLDIPGSTHHYTTFNVSYMLPFHGDQSYALPAPTTSEEIRNRIHTLRSIEGFDDSGNLHVSWQGCDPQDFSTVTPDSLHLLSTEHVQTLHDEFVRSAI